MAVQRQGNCSICLVFQLAFIECKALCIMAKLGYAGPTKTAEHIGELIYLDGGNHTSQCCILMSIQLAYQCATLGTN